MRNVKSILIVVLALLMLAGMASAVSEYQGFCDGVMATATGVTNGQAIIYSVANTSEMRMTLVGSYGAGDRQDIEGTGTTIWFLSQAAQKIVDHYPGVFKEVNLEVVDQSSQFVTMMSVTMK